MYRIGEFAEKINRSVQTLRRWDDIGQLKAHKAKSGHRYYTEDQYKEVIGLSPENSKKTVAYVRVSSRSQLDDLKSQKDYISDFCKNAGIPIDEWIEDVGSGLNFKRIGFNTLVKSVLDGEADRLIIAHPDRLVRFGYAWFIKLFSDYGCKTILINDERLSPQEELVQDLISIIHVFSCRIYGLRKYKKQIKTEYTGAK